jgi:hypothetical protein
VDEPLADADRDALTDALARHHAAGRLTLEQLEQRVAEVLQADSREQAAAALAGLPPLPSRQRPARFGRGHGETSAPGPGWVATNERFRDPTSRRLLRVWVDPVTGERHYVPEQLTPG